MQIKIQTVLPLVLAWLSLVNYSKSARILSVIPFPMKSHDIVYKPLLLELARRGHKVTSITCYPSDKVLHENYNEIVFETEAKDLIKNSDFYEIRRNTNIWNVGWTDLIEFWDLNNLVTENIFSTPAVEKLINSKDIKYDLVICEGFFSYESLFAFGELYEAPVITVASFGSSIYLNPNIGNPIESAYYPMFLLPYTDEMSLIQRTHNFVFNMYVLIASNLIHIPNQEKIMKKYFTDAIKPRKIRPLKDLLTNVSIAFVNSHVALGYPRPNLPNVIDVGGLHIQPLTNDTIDQDLQKLLDSATNGVIYFSLGSNVNIAKMPNNYKQAFLDAFSKLPQIVLWKSDDVSSFADTGSFPKNVKVRKWFQQQQVLGHKNCVAFITHGGLLSLEEALFNAIPIIGIPFFGDQFMNMKLVEKYYFGIELDYNSITYESVTSALNQVINNKMYKENAKRFSSIFKGDYQSPLERAVYWVEYVLKYDGAPHLKSRRRLLPITQLLLIDVLFFLTAIVFIFFKIINTILLRPIIRCFTGRKCRKDNSQEKISNETKKTK